MAALKNLLSQIAISKTSLVPESRPTGNFLGFLYPVSDNLAFFPFYDHFYSSGEDLLLANWVCFAAGLLSHVRQDHRLNLLVLKGEISALPLLPFSDMPKCNLILTSGGQKIFKARFT